MGARLPRNTHRRKCRRRRPSAGGLSAGALAGPRGPARLPRPAPDAAVGDLIALIGAVDGILQAQANADAGYFLASLETPLSAYRMQAVRDTVLKAYRWQYIVSGVLEPRFQKVLASMVSAAQMQRLQDALAPLNYAVPSRPAPQPLAA